MTVLKALNKKEVIGEYKIKLRTDKRKKRSKRDVLLQIKFAKVQIRKPHSVKGQSKQDPEYVQLYAVEAKEDKSLVPEDESSVHWLLFTTHKIGNYNQAIAIVKWYSFRWQIEQFFRITKKQGLDFESSQLETGDGLKKLVLLSFAAALRILQFTLARNSKFNTSASRFYSKQELQIIKNLNKQLEGETKKQCNPNKENTLAWVAWVIARLGSWSGYESQGLPGPITFKRGYDEFRLIIIGFNMVKNVYKE